MPPKRRSARLASKDVEGEVGPRSPRDIAKYAVNKLTSLLERDETPKKERKTSTAVLSPSKEDRMPGAFDSDESLLKTPQSAPPVRPSISEMHPSKSQQSTTKEPDSGLRLGFTDIKEAATPAGKAVETTPSKSNAKVQSPGFEFKWARKDNDELGAETQRIMDSVREEAARIKQQMQAEREEQARKDMEAGLISATTGRKIATPRTKGRFSDVHQAEFAKMDSIATHVSVIKTKTPGSQAPQRSLKRTKSRADLGEESSIGDVSMSSRFENTAPGKRKRARMDDDVSAARPATPETQAKTIKRTKVELPSVISTPTKASLARAASAKGIRTLAKLPQALASKTLKSPIAPKTEGSKKYFAALARAPSMKSILHRAQPKYSNDPVKIAAGTHVAPPKEMANDDTDYPSLISTAAPSLGRSPTIKRVGFNLGPEANAYTFSPSPAKFHDKVAYPTLSPTIPSDLKPGTPKAGDFTFRSSPHKPLKFGPAPRSPTKSSPIKPTVRRVRPSGISTPISPVTTLSVAPHGMPNKKRRRAEDDDDDENTENQPPGSAKRAKPNQSPALYPALSTSKNATHLDATEKRKEGLTPKKKGLSLSRLNVLARPKFRT